MRRRPADPASRPITHAAGRDWLFVGLPLAVFAAAFVACVLSGADLAISRPFYDPATERWPLKWVEPFAWCYHCGCRPAVILGVAGLVVGLATFVVPRLRAWRKPALFLGLTLGLGPGLLVNAVLKPNVARPRPYQVTEFGGAEAFAYVGEASRSGNHSFPSGHASMGFFFMTPALLLYRTRPGWAAAVFFAGLGYGSLVGVSRIVQGAHFASDVLGSALCVWSTGVVVLLGRRVLKAWIDAATRRGQQPDLVPISTTDPGGRRTDRAA